MSSNGTGGIVVAVFGSVAIVLVLWAVLFGNLWPILPAAAAFFSVLVVAKAIGKRK